MSTLRNVRILIIDDENSKRDLISECVKEIDGVEFSFDEAASYESAMRLLKSKEFDWVLLDMRITTYDTSVNERGGRPRNLGGEEILRKMARRNLTSKVIVVTQYSIFRDKDLVITYQELEMRLKKRYSGFVGLIQLKHSSDAWKESLKQHLSTRG